MTENGDDIVAQLKNLATKMFQTGNWGEDLETIKAAMDTIVDLRALAAIEEPVAVRQWVGLTDEERAVIVEVNTFDDHGYDIWCSGKGVALAIEAKLKQKNT